MISSDTETVAFRMLLRPGAEREYRRRHDEIWPELEAELRAAIKWIDCRIDRCCAAAGR